MSGASCDASCAPRPAPRHRVIADDQASLYRVRARADVLHPGFCLAVRVDPPALRLLRPGNRPGADQHVPLLRAESGQATEPERVTEPDPADRKSTRLNS